MVILSNNQHPLHTYYHLDFMPNVSARSGKANVRSSLRTTLAIQGRNVTHKIQMVINPE